MAESESRNLVDLPCEIILEIFKYAAYEETILALAQTHSRFRNILAGNTTSVYTALATRLYGPQSMPLFLLSRPDALPDKTRNFLSSNAKSLATGVMARIFKLGNYMQPRELRLKYQPQFWDVGEVFKEEHHGEMDKESYSWIHLNVTMTFWKLYEKILPTDDEARWEATGYIRPPTSLDYDSDNMEDEEKVPGCLGCQQPEGRECPWHRESGDQQWLDEFRAHDAADEFAKYLGGTTVTFDAYLRYLFFYARGATPHPDSQPSEYAAWKCSCLDTKNCRRCKAVRRMGGKTEGGFHFFDYSITENMTGKEWLALHYIEQEINSESKQMPFRNPFYKEGLELSFTDYWDELFSLSGLQEKPAGGLEDLDGLKRSYFAPGNRENRSFDLMVIDIEVSNGKFQEKAVVVKRAEWECIGDSKENLMTID
ncbi:hypothetical protein BJ508DRAFT_381846 [Ascobolus immersus RN42]|uniref:F-box domain-containing protein n=1 Tax=Ascobolus immersus RN42 TaxID=1160509 RepID=A0A3N4HQ88_ASCIM|nr:hypothetical protein BJ508DRAFT_381846 [Ascobolus immersus RN42]